MMPGPAFMLDVARWFATRGLSVIPIDHPAESTQTDPTRIGKVPLVGWKAFQTAPPTDADLQLWFADGRRRNFGIVTGAVSNLVVVDCDSPEAVAWADAHLPSTPWRSRTSKGEHRGYRHPGAVVANKVRINTGDPAIKIDVRGDGGYVVAPGSVHASGTRYEWIGEPPSVDALPVFDPAWLAVESPKVPMEALSDRLPEGSRNATLFKEGCRLRRLGLAQVEILAALQAINRERCDPPLSAQEVEAVACNAAKYQPVAVEFPLTEAGDAECFADLYQDQVRYDHRRGRWLVSDEVSGIWVPDPVERLTQMAVEMMRSRQRQALTLEGERKKRAIAWTIAGESRKRIANALALARSVPPIADPGEHWDEEPFLLGVQNGVIDLPTGHFRKAVPADRVTMRVRVSHDPAATCPLWLKTLGDIFAPLDLFTADDARLMVEFMQRALGYSITGDCREECCFIAWGSGCNGKGTTLNTLGWLFGDYTDDMPYSTLEKSERGSGIPNDVAKLVGRRFITCAEVNEFHLNEARLKALTGRDPMTARFLNHEFFTFIPVCKIWLATNNKPKIVGQDDGIWRRIHLIPFTQNFLGREDRRLKDELREELPGILNWVIEGARLWLRDGLNPPETVKAATAAYRQESNPITPFVEACCQLGADLRAQAAVAFKAYEDFSHGLKPWEKLTDKAFHRAMRERFQVQKVREHGNRTFYLGVGLPEPVQAPDEAPFPEHDEE
jgi:putative DNA primase/helicase